MMYTKYVFQDVLEDIKSLEECYYCDGQVLELIKIIPNRIESVYERIKLARIFLTTFSTEKLFPERLGEDLAIAPIMGDRFLNLPFPHIWIEHIDPIECLFEQSFKKADSSEGREFYGTKSILVSEVGLNYLITIFSTNSTHKIITSFSTEKMNESEGGIFSWVQRFLEKLASKDSCAGEVAINARFKERNGQPPHRVKKIIIVHPGKNPPKKLCIVQSRPVQWKHSWEVMGHFRKIEGVGKDRNGNYCIPKRTFVLPHTRGEGVLIKKSRILKDDQNTKNTMKYEGEKNAT